LVDSLDERLERFPLSHLISASIYETVRILIADQSSYPLVKLIDLRVRHSQGIVDLCSKAFEVIWPKEIDPLAITRAIVESQLG
jgi:hypothetical protein